MTLARGFVAGVLGMAFAFASAGPADAQYFGRNKVQWERLRLPGAEDRALRHLLLPGGEGGARSRSGAWPSAGTRACAGSSTTEFKAAPAVILYASHPHFQQTNTIGGAAGEGTGGVTEAFKRRIVLPVRRLPGGDRPRARPRARARVPVRHDRARARSARRNVPGRAAACRSGSSRAWPSTSRSGPSTRTPRCGCATPPRQEKLPTIASSTTREYFPYRYGQALWAYIAGRFGDEVVGDALRGVGAAQRRRGDDPAGGDRRRRRRSCPRTGTRRCARPYRPADRGQARTPTAYGARARSRRRSRAAS